jgi:alpha-glucosidase
MLKLRRIHPALRTARTTFLDAPEPILAFRRADLLCAFNLSRDPTSLDLPGTGEALLAQDADWTEGSLRLGPNGALIAKA